MEDHNTAMHHVIEVGDVEEVAMILGHKDRVRCGGIIRTGIKVPKQGLSPAELAKFKELESKGMPYDEIDVALGGRPKSNTSKLYPKNADHFVVRDCDFTRPTDAQFIREHYADKDGKVREIDIWLSVGDMKKILPHNFTAFDAAGRVKATTFYSGGQLRLRYLPKEFQGVPKKSDWIETDFDPNKKDDKGKIYDPAGRPLQFGGMLRFHVKGLKGLDEVMIPTKSWNCFSYSIALLRRVRTRLGRFDGTLNGAPFLKLVKSPEEVSDPKGNRVIQHIPVIELSVDPLELESYAEGRVSRGMAAVNALNGNRKPQPPVVSDFEDTEEAETEAEIDQNDPARIAANDYLHKLAKSIGVDFDALALWATVGPLCGGTVADASIEELRELANTIRARIAGDKEDLAELKNEIIDAVNQFGGEE